MTITTGDVRQAMADAITEGTGLRTGAYVQEQMVAPIAIVSRLAYDPRMVFSQAKAAYPFRVSVYVPRDAEISGQKLLDDYAEISGNESVVAAIQDGDLWSSDVPVDYAQVTNISEVKAAAIGESQYLVVELDVEVVW